MRKPTEILLVEDNPADVRLMREALHEASVDNHLSVAMDGEEAMRMLEHGATNSKFGLPDLIVLDLNLPRKSGREVLREIKAHDTLRRIPVVVLSSSNDADDITHVYDANGNCFIQKPANFDDFLSIVKTIEHFWLEVVHLPPKH